MTKKKVNYLLTPLWKEVEKIVKDSHYQGDEPKADADDVLYKKIITFLYRGPAGTLYEIKTALGIDSLKDFLDYIDFYLSIPNKPGHYYPSQLVKKQVQEIEQNNGLFNLKNTLNEISRLEYEKHGDKKARGWMPNEVARQKKSAK